MPEHILRSHAPNVRFEMDSQNSSRRSSRRSSRAQRKSRRSEPKSALETYQEEQAKKEMHLPFWERKEYCSYKQIKVLQPNLDTSIENYVNVKIDE